MRDADMKSILFHEYQIPYDFDIVPDTSMNKSDTCRALNNDYKCFQYANMCMSTGDPLKMCFESCTRYSIRFRKKRKTTMVLSDKSKTDWSV